MGFADRGDSFDLNVALQEHFKYVEKSAALDKEQLSEQPKLDLGFKEGQTITINFGVCLFIDTGVGNKASSQFIPFSMG